jgi:biopolymer transport protein ExbD
MIQSKFKKDKGSSIPKINTSSLPDIIFILLFFFMVATVLREVSLKVQNQLPQATEIEKIEDKSLVKYIYIGPPQPLYQKQYGTDDRIQLNDAISNVGDIGFFITSERASMEPPEKRSLMRISLKVDQSTKLGIVTDVKQELRKADALRINYASLQREEVY